MQALVLAPTHELVVQIAKEAEKLLPGADHAVVPIIGGVDVKRQVERLKKSRCWLSPRQAVCWS